MLSFFKNKLIETRTGTLGHQLEVKQHKGKYVLDADHVNYSFGGLHQVFRDAFKRAGVDELLIKEALVLGFGAGSVAGILVEEYNKKCRITGVEMDEVVIDLAKRYFNIDRFSNLTLYQQDALVFIRNNHQMFDFVVIDLYIDFSVPAFAESESFLQQVAASMEKDAVLFFNKMIYNIESEVSALKLKENLIDTFAQVEEYRMKYAVSNSVFICKK